MDDVLRSLLETAPHGLVAMNPDGTIRSANAAARALLGPDVVGRRLTDFLPGRYDPSRRAATHMTLLRAVGGRMEIGLVSSADGVERPVEIRVRLLAGDCLGLTLTDLSETQALVDELERLASVPELAPEPILELGEAGVTYRNPVAERLEGIEQPIAALVARMTADTETVELRHGEHDWSAVLHRIPAWGVTRAYLTDVTSRVRAEEELARANTTLTERVEARTSELAAATVAANEANQAKSSFLATMSHELRTPLNAIIGYAELLLEDEQLPELERIAEAARQLLQLVNDILDLSKIEAGRMTVEIEAVDVGSLLQDAVELSRPIAERNGNEVVVEAPVTHAVATDAGKVRQVVLNLLSNAAKFTRGGRITVRAELVGGTERTPDLLQISVSDTGIGIAPDKLDRLFQPFVQADPSTTRRFGGTGLGLALCREFATLLGGTVSVRSEPGVGSTFTLRLPATRATARTPTPTSSDRRGARVLVIDDDRSSQEVVGRTLTPLGYDVFRAANGDEGLELAADLVPDVILLDVNMPGRDGWSVLAALKATPSLHRVPVVLYTIADDRPRGLGLGAAEHLVKPVPRARLIEAVRRASARETGRVLVCEDDVATAELVRAVLTAHAWEVEVASDGEEALQRLGERIPDVVLLDLMMPKVDGFTVAARMRQDARLGRVPVVVMTAMDPSADELAVLRGSVSAIVLKVAAAVARHGPSSGKS